MLFLVRGFIPSVDEIQFMLISSHHIYIRSIDPIHKGVFLFLSYTNMNKMNSLYHVKEHPKISNFLQFESHSSKSFKVRAI